MDLGLRGKRALITGAASGIGFAAAKILAEEGCNLILWDRTKIDSETSSALEKTYAIEVDCDAVDILDLTKCEALLSQSEQRGMQIDHLVHCAAIGSGKFGFPFTKVEPSDWKLTIEVNIMGMANIAHLVAPRMIQQGYGSMVFLASVAGQIGSQTDPPYSASKAANINFAQCMAKDLAPHGIRVNTVCPGMVQTPLNESVWKAWYDSAPESERMSYEDWATKKIETVIPLKRWQTPEDIASMIAFLLSNRAGQVTGQTINVDGGFVMHW